MTLMAGRPRYSPEAVYFTRAYQLECQCLRQHYQLVQAVVNYQLMEERTYNQQLMCEGERDGETPTGVCLACGAISLFRPLLNFDLIRPMCKPVASPTHL